MADFVINKGVDLKDIALLIVYSSPPALTFTLPMSFLLSTVVTMGKLSSENEILALKANGVNLRCLYVPVCILGIFVLMAGFLNTNFALGKSSEAVRGIYLNILMKGVSFDDKEGIFNDSVRGIVIYIDRVDTNTNTLKGIIISDDREEQKGVKQTFTAETGSVNIDKDSFDLTFELKNGSGQRWERQSDTFTTFSFKSHSVSMNIKQILGYDSKLRKRKNEMTTEELLRLISVETDPEARYDLTLEIPKRFSIPFSVIAFSLLAVPLGIRQRREGKSSGVVYSLLIFIAYYILTALAENVGRTYQIEPFVISFMPNVIFCLLGLYLMKGLNSEDHGGITVKLKHLWEPYFAKTE